MCMCRYTSKNSYFLDAEIIFSDTNIHTHNVYACTQVSGSILPEPVVILFHTNTQYTCMHTGLGINTSSTLRSFCFTHTYTHKHTMYMHAYRSRDQYFLDAEVILGNWRWRRAKVHKSLLENAPRTRIIRTSGFVYKYVYMHVCMCACVYVYMHVCILGL